MKELTEYRSNLLQRLEAMAETFRDACLKVPDPYAPLDGGWNVHQIAVHTRDVNKLVYSLRARRTAVEDNPEFSNFEGEAHMAATYRSDEPLEDVVDQLVENVRGLAGFLHALPPEAWSRLSHHTTLGDSLTLQTWVERGLAHIEEHLGTIRQLA